MSSSDRPSGPDEMEACNGPLQSALVSGHSANQASIPTKSTRSSNGYHAYKMERLLQWLNIKIVGSHANLPITSRAISSYSSITQDGSAINTTNGGLLDIHGSDLANSHVLIVPDHDHDLTGVTRDSSKDMLEPIQSPSVQGQYHFCGSSMSLASSFSYHSLPEDIVETPNMAIIPLDVPWSRPLSKDYFGIQPESLTCDSVHVTGHTSEAPIQHFSNQGLVPANQQSRFVPLEFVFDSRTGQSVGQSQSKRSLTPEEKSERSHLVEVGGACARCKRSKRKCDILHHMFPREVKNQSSAGDN